MRRPTAQDLEEGMRSLKVPTLILVGDEDGPSLEPSLFMKRCISTSGLMIFPQTGHTINLEEPELFNRTVLDFLTSVESGDGRSEAEIQSRFRMDLMPTMDQKPIALEYPENGRRLRSKVPGFWSWADVSIWPFLNPGSVWRQRERTKTRRKLTGMLHIRPDPLEHRSGNATDVSGAWVCQPQAKMDPVHRQTGGC